MLPGPFFLLGSPRSGTTLLRNLLRSHPGLAAPEETHFYRWSSAFKSYFYESQCATETLAQHRALDGISEDSFWAMFSAAQTRRDLQEAYMREFVASTKPGAQWFDKTPQNSFGALLLCADYPAASLVHLVRHPMPVVASLLRGDAIEVTSLDEAICHWLEPVRTLEMLRALGGDIHLVHYADLVADPTRTVAAIGELVGFDPTAIETASANLRTTERDWSDVIDGATEAIINERCAIQVEALGLAVPRNVSRPAD